MYPGSSSTRQFPRWDPPSAFLPGRAIARRPIPIPRWLPRGLGSNGDRTQLARESGSLASAGLLISAALVGGPAGLIIAGAAAAVQALTALFTNVFSGCGQTCVEATRVVDTVEAQYLKPNLAAYFGQAVRTRSMQVAALQVFDYAWSMVLAGCGDPALGDAGRRCIRERQRGGSAPWCPTGTGCDWFTLYRDPIQNDPGVVPDALPVSAVGSTFLSSLGVPAGAAIAGLPVADLLLPAALVTVGLLL
jgi:hypothetical protein